MLKEETSSVQTILSQLVKLLTNNHNIYYIWNEAYFETYTLVKELNLNFYHSLAYIQTTCTYNGRHTQPAVSATVDASVWQDCAADEVRRPPLASELAFSNSDTLRVRA